ncbi:unnamed protein product, partial [marine sediment metagenome]
MRIEMTNILMPGIPGIDRVNRTCGVSKPLSSSNDIANADPTIILPVMSPELKEVNYFITPIIWPLSVIQIPFFPAWIIGGLAAALAGFIIGMPCLRVKGDYLAIVTYGSSEIIRFLICNFQSITN